MSIPYYASGAVPLAEPRGQADTGPRITRIETFATPLIGFVRVTTADGAQGWGQVSTYNSDITAQISGSVGIGPSSNIGAHGAMFEAIHGSAPTIAGQGDCQPVGPFACRRHDAGASRSDPGG